MGAAILVLLIPTALLAQTTEDTAFKPRFAVGGGAQLGSVVCYDCGDPSTGGVRGGFEYRLTHRLSVVTEGVWTGGYDVWNFQQDGQTYPGLTHDYFAFLEAKLRLEFSSMRHKPYMVFGGAVQWDHDTFYDYGGAYDERGWWQRSVDAATAREQLSTRGLALVGFGWAFKVGDRVEIRPEADLYIGQGAYASMGVTGWFNF